MDPGEPVSSHPDDIRWFVVLIDGDMKLSRVRPLEWQWDPIELGRCDLAECLAVRHPWCISAATVAHLLRVEADSAHAA